jgi:general secretion pathway protein G
MRIRAAIERIRRRLAGQAVAAEAGMTLIEIMVVVAIIGLLIGTVSVVAFNRMKKARITNAKQIVTNVKNAIEHYALENPGESCPKEIKALVDDGQLKKYPKDPWGQELVYKCPGEHDKDTADVSSMGPDKVEGTDDDIKSWEL